MSNANTVTVTINLETGHTATTVLPFEEVLHEGRGTTLDVTASAVKAARSAAATVIGLAGTASGRTLRDALSTVEAASRRPVTVNYYAAESRSFDAEAALQAALAPGASLRESLDRVEATLPENEYRA